MDDKDLNKRKEKPVHIKDLLLELYGPLLNDNTTGTDTTTTTTTEKDKVKDTTKKS